MNHIVGASELVARMGEWHPSDLAFIDAIAFALDPQNGAACVEMTSMWQSRGAQSESWPSLGGPWTRVVMRFKKVSRFRVTQPSSGRIQIMGFDIIDMTNNGLEGIRYEVCDVEDGRISLFCDDINILSVEPVA
jgi:hypothetical protein